MYVRPEIAAMAGYTPGEQPQGVSKYIKLNTNENPYPPPAGIRGAVEEVLQRGLNKYPDPMANAFRTRAAELLGLPGKDWILAGNGSDDILTICTRIVGGPGCEDVTRALPHLVGGAGARATIPPPSDASGTNRKGTPQD